MVYKSSTSQGHGTTINGESGNITLTSAGGTIAITTPTTDTINLEASGGSSVAFTALTSGTNTAAAMVVGTGASLVASGSGTISATSIPAAGIAAGTAGISISGNASTATTAANATNITTADDVATNSNYFPTYQTAENGTNPLKTSSNYTYNPSTGRLTAASFGGSLVGSVASATTATTQQSNANTTQVASCQFVQNVSRLTMASAPLSNITGGTYSYATIGSGCTITYTAVAGTITAASVGSSGGSGYKVGDLLTLNGSYGTGNFDAVLRVATVSGTAVATFTVIYGGTGYTSATSIASAAAQSGVFQFSLAGTLTSNATFIIPNGTYLAQSNQWIVANNTTGAFTTTFKISNGSNVAAGTGVVIPQGTGNSREVLIETDGVNDVWLCAVHDAADLTGTTLASGVTASSLTSVGTLAGLTVTATIAGSVNGNAATATTATNLAGGSGGTIPYQTASGATAMLANGTVGQVLQSNGTTTAPSWVTSAAGNALTSNPLSQFAATTSAQLAGVMSDETGSGALVFATSPTLVTPVLGTPASGVLTNCTGYTDANLSISDITTNNASTTAHGFLPKLSNISSQFLNGQGNYATPAGTANSYLTQSFSAQTSVVVTHNFGTYPVVQVIDNTGAVLVPLTITNSSLNAFTVTFVSSTTGNIIASVGSPQPNTFITVTNDYTVLVTDYFVNCSASGKTMTLPTAVGNSGRVFQIINSSTGNITVATTSSQTINGSLTKIIPSNSCMSIVSDGTNYLIF